MFALTVLVLVWCQVSVSGQIRAPDFVQIFTHPETGHPVKTGLVRGVHPVSAFVTNVVSQRLGTSSGTFDAGTTALTVRHQCDTLLSKLFRTADGSCNNRDTRGQSLQPLARLLQAQYDDGVQSPRQASVVGSSFPLPSPRLVSRVVHPDLRHATTRLTIFVMQWGQFIDHEMVSTPLPVEDTRGVIECCGPNRGPPLGNESSECFPILFSPGDPDFRGTCMSVVRSHPVNDSNGNIVLPRENVNLISSFIDASTVYGSTLERQEELRNSTTRYLLRTTEDGFPPSNGIDDCIKRDARDICFLAGDDRVNELPGLTLLHTVFVRYHNLLAQSLRQYRPSASEELIFQQARAIVGAVMQKIQYSDWLPIVLGPKIRQKYDLDIGDEPTEHKPSQDPTIFTSFSTAVFRFGHTLIPRSLPLTPTRRPLLRELFFKPFEARENLDTLADGLAKALDFEDRSQPFDRFFVDEITGHLFENQEPEERSGFDLVALNIQRGRDHGLPAYNTFREFFDLGRVSSFGDPALGSAGSCLQEVYLHPDDIDLFSGGMSEPAFNGGLVGETFSNLMGLQFQKLRFGDRFFFNNRRDPFGFTKLQRKLINRIKLSTLLCLTTGITRIQPDVFRIPERNNRRRSCGSLIKRHPSMRYFARYPF